MLVLGIAGTAKNTGKTTTTVSIVNYLTNPSRLAVTSIGYDGESKDNVTGLPKPRLNVPAGVIIVTAESCLEAGSARIEMLEKTDIGTPLGKLVIGRVRTPGLVVLAGPNNESALKVFITKLPQWGVNLLLVDGALGRLAPMSATDGLVLATGAARTRDLDRLAKETAAFAALLDIPSVQNLVEPVLELGSLLVEKQGEQFAEKAIGYSTVEFTGVVDVKPLIIFLEKLGSRRPDLVLRDPVKLLLSQDPVEMAEVLNTFIKGGGRIMVRQQLPLKVITVNPFFPDYNQANRQYAPGFLDAELVYNTIADAVSVPVVDVVRQGSVLARILDLE